MSGASGDRCARVWPSGLALAPAWRGPLGPPGPAARAGARAGAAAPGRRGCQAILKLYLAWLFQITETPVGTKCVAHMATASSINLRSFISYVVHVVASMLHVQMRGGACRTVDGI